MSVSFNSVLKLSKPIGHLVVGVSGIAKDTFGSLSHLKGHALKAIEQVKRHISGIENKQKKSSNRFLAIVFDGFKIIFVRKRKL